MTPRSKLDAAAIENGLAGLTDADRRRVLWDNTAALYGIEAP